MQVPLSGQSVKCVACVRRETTTASYTCCRAVSSSLRVSTTK